MKPWLTDCYCCGVEDDAVEVWVTDVRCRDRPTWMKDGWRPAVTAEWTSGPCAGCGRPTGAKGRRTWSRGASLPGVAFASGASPPKAPLPGGCAGLWPVKLETAPGHAPGLPPPALPGGSPVALRRHQPSPLRASHAGLR